MHSRGRTRPCAEAKKAAVGGEPGSAPDGTPDGGYLADALKSAYDGADESLIEHIARMGEPECWVRTRRARDRGRERGQ